MKTTLAAFVLFCTTISGPVFGCPTDQESGIQWFGTMDGGMAEARRTGRPILLMSAAPQCRNISGIW